MPRNKFSSDNQPPKGSGQGKRGKHKRTLIIEAFERVGKSKEDFYDHLVNEAMQPGNHIPLKEVIARLHPADKATYPLIQVDIPENATPSDQIDYLVRSVAEGKVPIDIAEKMIAAIYKGLEAKEMGEIQERLDTLEKLLNGKKQASD